MLVLFERYRSVFRPSPITIRWSVVLDCTFYDTASQWHQSFLVSRRRSQAGFTTSVFPVFKSAKFVQYNQLAKVRVSAAFNAAWFWLTKRLNCQQAEKNTSLVRENFVPVSVSSVDVQWMSRSLSQNIRKQGVQKLNFVDDQRWCTRTKECSLNTVRGEYWHHVFIT